MAQVSVRKVVKAYEGGVQAVKGIDLEIADHEFVVLVGPSGCGKSTTLRMIAGLEEITGGEIAIGGTVVNDIPPRDRDIAMVFQNYALYPHMSVYENMAFGLTLRKFPKEEIKRRVENAARILDITPLLERKPKALSGGQRQRVAMGRAIVRDPKVFLFDEPLSNLDAKLRQEMRVELRRLLKSMQVAAIFVTHDQEEAIILSDRVVLMNDGRIEQQGTPEEIYDRPRSLFTAAFLGQSNFLQGTLKSLMPDGTATVDVGGNILRGFARDGLLPGTPATMVVKTERVSLLRPGEEAENRVEARFEFAGFLGASVQLQCMLGDQRITALLPGARGTAPAADQPMPLGWSVADTLVFPRAG